MEQVKDILIGREAEIKHFDAIVSSKEAEFVVVYGRRRVGKTLSTVTSSADIMVMETSQRWASTN